MASRVLTTILQSFAFVVLIVIYRVAADVQLGKTFGGPHGAEFSDQTSVAEGQTVGSITIRSGERAHGLSLEITGPTPQTYSHGGGGGTENTLTLGKGEYITSMEAHWDKKNGRTRIFYLNFGTSAGNSVSGGARTSSAGSVTAPAGYQLGGFYGRDGDEIDLLGVIWSSMADEGPGTVTPANISDSGEDDSLTSVDTSFSVIAAPVDTSASVEQATPSSAGSSDAPAQTASPSVFTASGSINTDIGSASVGSTAVPPITSSASAGSAKVAPVGSSSLAGSFTAAASGSSQLDGSGSAAPAPAGTETPVPDATDVPEASVVAPVDSGAASAAAGTVNPEPAATDVPAASVVAPVDSGAGSAAAGTETPESSVTDAPAASVEPPVDSGAASAAGTEAPGPAATDVPAVSVVAPVESGAASAASGTVAPAPVAIEAPAPTEAPAPVATETPAPVATEAPAPVTTEAPAPAAPVISVEDSVQLSESFGGPHGNPFSDEPVARSGQTITSLSIHAGERLDGLTLEVAAPKKLTITHGGTGGSPQTLMLGVDEFITSMEVHWGKKNGHTRIFYASFITSMDKSLAGGTMTADKNTVTAPAGFQLGGFFGRDGDEIDTLGAVWTSIVEVTVAPPVTTAPAITDTPQTIKQAVQLSESFGGPHGEQFSDQASATSGQTISSIIIRSGERSHGISLEVTAPTPFTLHHGGFGGTDNILRLGAGEYITSMDAHWGKHNGRTRIFYLNFVTNLGNSVSGGSQTEERGTVIAPEGYQLGGFFGRSGDEIDLIGAVWTSIEAVVETPAPAVSADEDIALSEIFGGPHGIAFSDINKIKFGQTVSSITIRAGERIDAVTLQIATPEAVTLNHGGSGGTENTLTLGEGEYITTVEAHWGKKNGRTRVFYLNFGTSAGNSIFAGTQTDDKSTVTAPEGFQLAGFHGRAENEVDQLGVIWTRISATNILLTDIEGVGSGTYGTTIRNWVGPTIGDASDTACYRKTTAFDSNNICPLGYGKDDDDCLAQCPLSYPVSCGAECIPQNDDCALEVLMKIGSVLFVALNALSGGVMGQVMATYKTLKWGIACASNIISVVRSLVYYLRNQQTAAPQGDTEELLAVAYQADVVLIDIPRAVCVCLNIPVPKGTNFADIVLQTVEGIVKQAITNGDEIISTGKNVMDLISGNSMNTSGTTVDELQDLIDKKSNCGYELKRLTDRVVDQVLDIRNKTPDMSAADTRVIVYKSSLVLNDIPAVTNNCMGELLSSKTLTAAYQTRDMLRKTFAVIVDQLIDSGKTDMGKDVAEGEYLLKVANMGLVAISALDPTGIAYMASQFVQPICGPTAYLGEIDDGTLYDALGLTTVDEAFEGSYGSWTRMGDGVVHLVFESTDTKDVTVVIHSGGDNYDEVDVGAGDTVTWDGTLSQMQDKQMYLDRWRPGFLGVPGSGGGSLLLWIPRSSQGGHITMHVRINVS